MTHLSDLVSTRAGDFMPALSCSAWAANGSQTLGTSNQEGENSCKTDEGGRAGTASLAHCLCHCSRRRRRRARAGGPSWHHDKSHVNMCSTVTQQSGSPSAPVRAADSSETRRDFNVIHSAEKRRSGVDRRHDRTFPLPVSARVGWDEETGYAFRPIRQFSG